MPRSTIAWERIDAALDELLSCEASERESRLSAIVAGDEAYASELRSLLAAHDASGAFLEDSAAELSEPFLRELDDGGEHAGMEVGRYRLVECIGRGGMGTVWLAERADGEFEHRVAIKLVKRGMDTDEVIARFRRERQILARLNHESIARLIDGGVAADGRPYLVMEHVAGEPITDYCTRHQLGIDDRLQLFDEVCRAVHHAHQNLVVHRDIKPSNVLVAVTGRVKLLDFGIAKVLETATARETRTGWHRPLTIHYASPEQLTGAVITTASDVYQLGLLLHELLTGRRVVSSDPRSVVELQELVCHHEAPPPSAAAPTEVQRALRGNLDAIAMTALQNNPVRRYASAHALAEDLRRHRLGLAISARVSRMHRVGRALHRHRRAVFAVSTTIVAVATTAAVYAVRLRAERDAALLEAEKGRQSAEFVRRFLEGWNPGAADSTKVNVSFLLGEARRRTDAELARQPAMRGAMLSLLGELYAGSAQYAVAETLLTNAARLQRESGSPPADLAITLMRQGALAVSLQQYERADSLLTAASSLHESLLGPQHPETRRTLRLRGTMLASKGEWVAAESVYRRLLANSGDTATQPSLFDTEVQAELGYALFEQSRLEDARAMLQDVLTRQRRQVGNVHSSIIFTTRALASTLRDMGRLDEAEVHYREALRVAEALYGPQHTQSDVTRFVLALHLHRSLKLDEAERMARDAIARFEREPILASPMAPNWTRLLGMVLLDDGRDLAALVPLRRALTELRRMYPDGNEEEADVLNRLAYIAARHSLPDRRELLDEAIALRARRDKSSPDHVTDGLHFLAWAMAQRGDVTGAKELYARAEEVYATALQPRHPYRAFVRTMSTEGR